MNITNWFTAVVENINDPLNAGRVQIRCFDYHSQDTQMIPSKDLPWAMPIMPLTSAAQGGVGTSATGLQVGTWVFGFFRDEDLQDPVILGSVPGIVSGSTPSIPGGAGSATAGAAPGYGAAMTGSQTMSGVPAAQPGDLSSLQNQSTPIQVSGDVANRLISIGKNELGVVETSKNQGPGIEKYWTATNYGPSGYKNREPWCAAFTSWVIKQAGVLPDNLLPNSASAFGYNAWAEGKARSVTQLRYNPREVLPGDLVIFNFSHIGIATTRSEDGKFRSVEGNTNAAGSREGNGVEEKTRSLSLVRSAITITGGTAPATTPTTTP